MSFVRDKEHAKEICKAGQEEKQCAYLGVASNGYECWKESKISRQIDQKVHDGLMSAKGDNCVGFDRMVKDRK
jgi:hypothetical protein